MSDSNYAGFWMRFVAWLIDLIILGFVFSLVVTPILGIIGLGATAMDYESVSEDDIFAIVSIFASTMGVVQLINAVLGWLYFALLESGPRQATIGKMALGIKVTDVNGERIDFLKASLRYVGKYISSLIFMIGYIMAAFTEKKQALHDIIASTLVVKK